MERLDSTEVRKSTPLISGIMGTKTTKNKLLVKHDLSVEHKKPFPNRTSSSFQVSNFLFLKASL